MSTSVLRRYTPPTCTLEIAATGSALSRWTDRTVLKNLRFQLSFDDPKLPPEQQVTIRGDRFQLEALCEAVEAYVQKILNQPPEKALSLHAPTESEAEVDRAQLPNVIPLSTQTNTINGASDRTGIRLKPQGLMAHELCLGTLADSENNSVICLNLLQLFDLANALDAYHAEALTLPALGRPGWMKSPAGWARIAAVALLTVGATGAIAKFVMDVSAPPQIASSDQEVEVSSAQRAESSTNSSGLPVPPGVANAPANLKVDQPLLPPKPPAGALQPVPVPNPALVAPPAGSVSVNELPASQPAVSQPVPNSTVAIAPDSLPALPTPADPQIASGSTSSVTTSDPLADADAPAAITSAVPDPTAVRLAPSGIPITGESRAAAETASQPAPPLITAESGSTSDSTQVAARNTAFDSYPQIAEVRDYFVQNWQPPEELNQTLEYRLVLNAEGAIQLIVPLGDASARYVDRTNMPLMDEAFVSPLQDTDRLQVRLVLDPNGQVRTFAEGN